MGPQQRLQPDYASNLQAKTAQLASTEQTGASSAIAEIARVYLVNLYHGIFEKPTLDTNTGFLWYYDAVVP